MEPESLAIEASNDVLASPSTGSIATEGGRRPSGVAILPVDPEYCQKPRKRRSFSVEERLRILGAIDTAHKSGEHGAIGKVLRLEGVYASQITDWRQQLAIGSLNTKRGPKPTPIDDLRANNEKLQREIRQLKARLHHAEQIIDLQKKVSNLLAIPLDLTSVATTGAP
jgi:transposase